MKFSDCYKNIISDICEFNKDWNGYESKYLDECDLSNDSLIELFNWTLLDVKKDIPSMGTTSPVSVTYCYGIPLISNTRTYGENPLESPYNAFAKLAF
jgi:hypothetical protein